VHAASIFGYPFIGLRLTMFWKEAFLSVKLLKWIIFAELCAGQVPISEDALLFAENWDEKYNV